MVVAAAAAAPGKRHSERTPLQGITKKQAISNACACQMMYNTALQRLGSAAKDYRFTHSRLGRGSHRCRPACRG